MIDRIPRWYSLKKEHEAPFGRPSCNKPVGIHILMGIYKRKKYILYDL